MEVEEPWLRKREKETCSGDKERESDLYTFLGLKISIKCIRDNK